MHVDRDEMAESRFRTLLLKWLAKLPPDGWKGTSHELGEELDSFAERHGLYAYVPISAGKKVAGMTAFISANGITLTHRRSKHARTLRFSRSSSGSDSPDGGTSWGETVGA
jgi:hypothetical protein